MDRSFASLLAKLASLDVSAVRFTVTGRGRACHRGVSLHGQGERSPAPRSLPKISLAALFAAYALAPRQGNYTLHVASGTLCYEPFASSDRPARPQPGLVRARS